MVDPAAIFAEAQQAFAGGNAGKALDALERLPGSFAAGPDVLHLRALALKRQRQLAAAGAAFEQALQAAPNDPQIANNFANLLKQTGALEAALVLYDRALAAQPNYRDARYNKGLTLQSLGRLEDSLGIFAALCEANASDARAQSARATVLLALERHEAALALQPGLAVPLHGRARLALECGEPDAIDRYRTALRISPGNLELVLGLAEALESDAYSEAVELLGEAVTLHPEWIAGFERLARMRAEAGEADFAAHYRTALDNRPGDSALTISFADVLAEAGRNAEALAALADAGDVPAVIGRRALYLGEIGDPERGLQQLIGLGEQAGSELGVTRARLALQAGEAELAEMVLERLVEAEPQSIHAWGLLELVWRLTGDDRAEWLSGQPGLIGARDVGLSSAELAAVAELLRGLHRTRAHPIGQSLRGGTQTRGRLFLRNEPELLRLSEALSDAVIAHTAGLPAGDPNHPLLRHRNRPLRIAGSWSVRLSGSGFHVNHIHPQGLLSSACYIALPASTGDRAGWLELGRPPIALGLTLEPRAMIEPRPGRLALFPSYLYHGTRPFAQGERLTVAFDVIGV
jgi:Tfp pilus assembly protein PilF